MKRGEKHLGMSWVFMVNIYIYICRVGAGVVNFTNQQTYIYIYIYGRSVEWGSCKPTNIMNITGGGTSLWQYIYINERKQKTMGLS